VLGPALRQNGCDSSYWASLSGAAGREVVPVSVIEEGDTQLHDLAAVMITTDQDAAPMQLSLEKARLNSYACSWVSYINGINNPHSSGNYLNRVHNFPFLRMIKQRHDLLLS
jgi:hypothetical protein